MVNRRINADERWNLKPTMPTLTRMKTFTIPTNLLTRGARYRRASETFSAI
jgi:hypothetical protein